MKIKVQRWGNSLAVRSPKSFSDDAGLSDGVAVEMRLVERSLIVERVFAAALSLDELLDRVTPKNLHGEVDTGTPHGAEAW